MDSETNLRGLPPTEVIRKLRERREMELEAVQTAPNKIKRIKRDKIKERYLANMAYLHKSNQEIIDHFNEGSD